MHSAQVVALTLVSQTWQGIVWKHQLFLFMPTTHAVDSRQGLFIVSGGRWRDSYATQAPAELPDDAKVFLEMAQRLDTVVAVRTHSAE